MVYDDPLSQLSLKKDPTWPTDYLKTSYYDHTDQEIEEKLAKMNFDLDMWIKYKQRVPNDGLPRSYTHPNIEYPLTKEEYDRLSDYRAFLCNPSLCPNKWEIYSKDFGEVEKRYEWLMWQESFLHNGFPKAPYLIWGSNKALLQIFTHLIYNPFIEYWGQPPDDFWIKLSEYLEGENQELIHRGLILVFHSQGRVFPSPDLYNPQKDPNPESLFLPKDYWKQAEVLSNAI